MKNKDRYDLTKLKIRWESANLIEVLDGDKGLFITNGWTDKMLLESLLEWLEEEYQEHITLTDDEKVILKNIDKDYKWVARDKNDNLYVYNEKPIRSVSDSEWKSRHRFITINTFKHLFKLIKWEDEPYNIDELLKQNGVER